MSREACDRCLRRTDLIAALAGRIEVEWRRGRGRARLLALADDALLEWGGDAAVGSRYEGFEPDVARERIRRADLVAVCRCASDYPSPLLELPDPPAVLHRSARVEALPLDGVAIVGARRASAYGIELARSLARGLAASGVPVVSGMALGIDSAAHCGALEGAGLTVAVLGSGADVAYPSSKRTLHRRIAGSGIVVSEMPPGFGPYRWSFPARNRIIAALSAATVVVEGGERSGSLITADFAAELGRPVAAVPGQVTARGAAGTNLLLKNGAELVRGAEDVLELLFGVGSYPGSAAGPALSAAAPDGTGLEPRLRAVLEGVEQGRGSIGELADGPDAAREIAAALGELELRGLVRRTFGGRYLRAA